MFNCFHPIYFPIWLPQRCSRWTKNVHPEKKGLGQICINSFDDRMLSHNRWLWFFFWADAAIWWCLRTGGGGVLTRMSCYRQAILCPVAGVVTKRRILLWMEMSRLGTNAHEKPYSNFYVKSSHSKLRGVLSIRLYEYYKTSTQFHD
jgi:hypothetical protein